MISSRHVTGIIIVVMVVAVVLCFLAVGFSGALTKALGGTGVTMEYESKLFNTDEIITVDIRIDESDWNKMLSDATSEEYYSYDVVINGTKIRNVAIRPKGNTSLSAIAMDPESDRFSLKLEFGHYVEGQTCFGLDKLILNNNYADAGRPRPGVGWLKGVVSRNAGTNDKRDGKEKPDNLRRVSCYRPCGAVRYQGC